MESPEWVLVEHHQSSVAGQMVDQRGRVAREAMLLHLKEERVVERIESHHSEGEQSAEHLENRQLEGEQSAE
jgi:hypothetical protein